MTLKSHVRSWQIELARSIEDKAKIYLDTNYWITVRDVVLGRNNASPSVKLVELLRAGVHDGLIVCPVSESTFIEVLKQSDQTCRQATAALIEELSLGVSLIPQTMRLGTELSHLLHALGEPTAVHPLEHLVWTKLSYVVGFIHPENSWLSPSQQELVQIAFFDHLWSMSVQQTFEQVAGHSTSRLGHFDQLATTLNRMNAEHSSGIDSYQRAYTYELHGVLSCAEDVLADIVVQMASAAGSTRFVTPEEHRVIGRQMHQLIYAALQRDSIKRSLPTIHVNAVLYAKMRWDKRQRFTGNDFFDFQHATAALGYCDALFTEKGLCKLLTEKDTALCKMFHCEVHAKCDDAVRCLASLCA